MQVVLLSLCIAVCLAQPNGFFAPPYPPAQGYPMEPVPNAYTQPQYQQQFGMEPQNEMGQPQPMMYQQAPPPMMYPPQQMPPPMMYPPQQQMPPMQQSPQEMQEQQDRYNKMNASIQNKFSNLGSMLGLDRNNQGFHGYQGVQGSSYYQARKLRKDPTLLQKIKSWFVGPINTSASPFAKNE